MVEAKATGALIGDVPVVTVTPKATTREVGELALMVIAIGGGLAGVAIVGYRLASGCWVWDLGCQAEKAAGVAKDLLVSIPGAVGGGLTATGKAVWDTSYKAGEATGEEYNALTLQQGGAFTPLNMLVTQARSNVQGDSILLKAVPQTPQGDDSSNWTWQDDKGANLQCDASTNKCTGQGPLMIGLPAGQTLSDFCGGSPSSPICSGVSTKKGGVLGLGMFGL